MKFGKIAAAVAALSLTAAPAMAQATTAAAKLSLSSVDRTGAQTDDGNELAGSNILFGVLVVAAIIGAIVAIAGDDDEDDMDDPVSP